MNARWMMIAGLLCGALTACDDPTVGPGEGEVPGSTPSGTRDAADNPPFQQNEQAGDLQTTAAVRRAILDAQDLGSGADNAIITTQAGVVTLRGNVASQAEKDQVEQIARGVPGVVRIDNQLMVGDVQNAPDAGEEGADGAQAPNPR